MRPLIVLLAMQVLAWGSDDAWAKLREVKSGAELRVYKIGSAQPLLVKMGELTDEHLVIIEKNKQTAIARDQIDRVEARPTTKRTVSKETKVTDNTNDPKNVIPSPAQQGTHGPNTSTSTTAGMSFDKPPFETVYRRAARAPKKD